MDTAANYFKIADGHLMENYRRMGLLEEIAIGCGKNGSQTGGIAQVFDKKLTGSRFVAA
jgi:hypothetical protein